MKPVTAYHKATLIAFASSLIFYSSSSIADCLKRVADFANDICGEVERTGRSEVVDAAGNIDVGLKGLISKFVGEAGVGVGGKRSVESYENVLREQLGPELFNVRDCRLKMVEVGRAEACQKSVEYKTCRHKDFGRAGWEYTQDFSGSSGWRDGGTSQQDWCRSLANSIISQRSIGPDHEVSTVTSGEDAKWTWDRHRKYKYSCTVRISWGAIYAEKQDPRCGSIQAAE